MKLLEHLGRCSVPSAYKNTSASSAEPLTTSKPNERMKRGLQRDPGKLDLKFFKPESGKWETPIRQEPGNWEKTPGRTAGLPGWSGISDTEQDPFRKKGGITVERMAKLEAITGVPSRTNPSFSEGFRNW